MVDLPQVVPFSSADEESISGRVAPAATVDNTTPTKVHNHQGLGIMIHCNNGQVIVQY